MVLGLSGFKIHATPFSTAPDWNHKQDFRVNLSGKILEFSIPGNISADFPPQPPTDQNVYDPEHYAKWPSFLLSEFYWDYKARNLIWQEIYGTLKMRINVHQAPEQYNKQVLDLDKFPNIIEAVLRDMYNVPSGHNITDTGLELPEKSQRVALKDNTTAFKYTVKGGSNQSGYIAYAIPLNESYFLKIMFTIMVSHSKEDKNWYQYCLQDIDKIINRLSLTSLAQ